jgi:hypothetical protein
MVEGRTRDKGGQSSNKFRKSKIRKSADFLRSANLQQTWQFADLRFSDHILFCNLRTQLFLRTKNFCTYINFLLTNIGLKFLIQILGRLLGQFWEREAWHLYSKIYRTYVGRKSTRQTNADLDQKHCFFLANLRINRYKFAGLRFAVADCHTAQKFVDLRLRNELKNLRICDLWANKKICVPTFVPRTKSISALKINILLGRLDSILASLSTRGIDFSSHNLS